jgi:hypothetical protein
MDLFIFETDNGAGITSVFSIWPVEAPSDKRFLTLATGSIHEK